MVTSIYRIIYRDNVVVGDSSVVIIVQRFHSEYKDVTIGSERIKSSYNWGQVSYVNYRK